MRVYDIIKSKRDNKILTSEEINYIIENYTNGNIPNYQVSALLMAIYLNKMNDDETLDLTLAMVNSGERVDLSKIIGFKVDKHSTGGVADTTTLVLGPMIAALDIPFVKMSGRGLGHTGGTLDKLDSIENFNTNLSKEELINNTNDIKLSISGQTANIAPADKLIYALRDVTATVENLSLISSSIMSKKLALGADGIVLDIKLGKGAFIKKIEDAIELSQKMVNIGNGANKDTIALITNMNQPLGNAIGNSLEVKEAIEILKGEHLDGDLFKVSLALGIELLLLSNYTDNRVEAETALLHTIKSGTAFNKFLKMVELQNGNVDMIMNLDLLPKSKYTKELYSDREGYIIDIDAEDIGKLSLYLGAGRETVDSKIDLAVGIILNKRVGDFIKKGELLATIFYNNIDKGENALNTLDNIIKIDDKSMVTNKLIYGIVTKDGFKEYN